MKRQTQWLVAAPLLIAVGAGGAELVHHLMESEADEHAEQTGGADPEKAAEVEPERIASVRVAPVRRGALTLSTEALGSVVARPGAPVAVSLAGEVQVQSIAVIKGQAIHAGDPLMLVAPSPQARLQLELAGSAVESSNQLLEAARSRRALNLGTTQELLQAEAAAKEAQARLAVLQKGMPPPDGSVRAPIDGLVADVHAQPGSAAGAQTVLAEIVPLDGLAAQLGVPPETAASLKPGDAIGLSALDGAPGAGGGTVQASVIMIGPGPNSATHLTDVFAAFPSGALPLGAMTRAQIARSIADALLVPRAAVLPHDGGFRLFIVKDGHAIQTEVEVTGEDNRLVAVRAPSLHEGDPVVILGNYELEDGMAVAVESGGGR